MARASPHGCNERRARVQHRQVPGPQDLGLRFGRGELDWCIRVLPAGQRGEEAQAQGIAVRRRRYLQRRHRNQGRTREPVGLYADKCPQPACDHRANTSRPQRHHRLVPTTSPRPLRHDLATTVSPSHACRHHLATTLLPPRSCRRCPAATASPTNPRRHQTPRARVWRYKSLPLRR